MEVTLLTTAGCHLCEQAETLVHRAAPSVTVIQLDIAEQDELIEAYGTRIPVLRIGNRELGWPFSLLDVRAFVAADA